MLNKLLSATSLLHLNMSWPSLTPAEIATLVLALFFGVCLVLELRAPGIKVSGKLLRQSYRSNFSLFLFNSVMMSLLSGTTLLIVAKNFSGHGLLSGISDPLMKSVLSLLAADFLLYFWHKACHRFDRLWLFHKVHHNDPCVNVSTGFRIHICELLITHILKVMLIIAMGIDELMVLISETVTTLFIMLHHSNISFKGEKWLGFIFTTPALHRTHHSVERKEHDSNYGAIFSVWDRMFGTLSRQEPVALGIKGDSPMDFVNLIKFGFTTQWPKAFEPLYLNAMIAEAAYYKAEKRNFMPGQEMNDWLEAQQEIIQMVCGNRKKPVKSMKNIYFSLFDGINFTRVPAFKH